MFVTCLYGVLDPADGALHLRQRRPQPARQVHGGCGRRAAGHRACRWDCMPGMTYDEHEATLGTGESILIYSDGLVEAHNPQGEMFGFPRLRHMACGLGSGADADRAPARRPGRLRRSGLGARGRRDVRDGGADGLASGDSGCRMRRALRSSSPTSPSPARRTTNARRWSRSPRQWPGWTCRPTGWSGSRPRWPRRR